MWRTIAFSGATLLAAAGCGGAAVPTEATMNALAAIRSAQAVGAEEYPESAYHLELAQAELARSQRQIDHGDMAGAERTLDRARADADLAVALAHEKSVEAEAEDVRARIEAMRERHM